MNLEMVQIADKLDKHYFEKNDMIKYILPELNLMNALITPQLIKNYLSRSNYWELADNHIKNVPVLQQITLWQLKSDKLYVQIMRSLFNAFPNANKIYIRQSEMNEVTFSELARMERSLQIICLTHCLIGDQLSTYLGVLKLDNLRELVIQRDPISNKGIKALLKIHLPSLIHIRFMINSNLTTDFTKTLKKLNHGVVSIAFAGPQRIVNTVFLKEVASLLDPPEGYQTYKSRITISPFYRPHDSYYVCQLAKKKATHLTIVHPHFLGRKCVKYPLHYRMQITKRAAMTARNFFYVDDDY